MLGWSQTMTLEQFEQVNARLREWRSSGAIRASGLWTR
jgi:hypothetical protein